jgi:3-oxoacyl-[acyl-carrier protein] reductase
VSGALRSGGLGGWDPDGRIVVVIGGSSGIGAAIAKRFAEAGAKVVITYRTGADRAAAVLSHLPGVGHSALRVDVLDSHSLTEAAEAVAREHGRVDVLVNSGGTTVKVPHGDLDGLTDEDFDEVLRTNVRGPFATVRAFRSLLEASGDSVVVNVSSISAFTGAGSSVAYCASKAALDSVTRSLGRVLAPRIRLVSVSPAAVDTAFVTGRTRDDIAKQAAMTPLQILVDPDDVAISVLGIVTHLRLTTGVVVVTDGGRSL